MTISIPTIEDRLRSEFAPSPKLERFIGEVREAVSGHIHTHHNEPRDIFHMRLKTNTEHVRNIPAFMQTHLIICFRETPLDPLYLKHLEGSYGKLIYLHLPFKYSLIL